MDIYAKTKDLYTRKAQEFDVERSKNLFEKSALDRLLARCPPSPDILYLGSGTGEPVAQYLIEQGAQITGVDFAAPMVAIAQSRFPDQIWIEADIRAINLNKQFDAIISWSGMFHLTRPYQIKMFPLFRSHLKPRGCVMITTGTKDEETYGAVTGEPVYCASLAPAHFRKLFVDHGFGDIDYRPEDPDCNGFTLWLATYAP